MDSLQSVCINKYIYIYIRERFKEIYDDINMIVISSFAFLCALKIEIDVGKREIDNTVLGRVRNHMKFHIICDRILFVVKK